MASTYHFDCKPEVSASQYRTLYSKHENTCNNCGREINVNDKIAWFPKDAPGQKSQQLPPAQPAGDDLRKELALLKSSVEALKGQVNWLIENSELAK